MKTPPALLLCSLLAGCATTGATRPSADDLPETLFAAPLISSGVPAVLSSSELAAPPALDEDADSKASFASFFSAPVSLPAPSSDFNRYMMIKGGYYRPDTSIAGDGFNVNLAYGMDLGRLIAVELEGGYFQSEIDLPGADLYGVPLMINGRVGLPVWILEAYGGLGVGPMYYKVDAPGAFGDDGWMFAGNVFLGADAVIHRFAVGLEVKYYMTDKVGGVIDDNLNALAAFLKVGVRF